MRTGSGSCWASRRRTPRSSCSRWPGPRAPISAPRRGRRPAPSPTSTPTAGPSRPGRSPATGSPMARARSWRPTSTRPSRRCGRWSATSTCPRSSPPSSSARAWEGEERGVGATFLARNNHPAVGEYEIRCLDRRLRGEPGVRLADVRPGPARCALALRPGAGAGPDPAALLRRDGPRVLGHGDGHRADAGQGGADRAAPDRARCAPTCSAPWTASASSPRSRQPAAGQ